jgi:hypothetical protein
MQATRARIADDNRLPLSVVLEELFFYLATGLQAASEFTAKKFALTSFILQQVTVWVLGHFFFFVRVFVAGLVRVSFWIGEYLWIFLAVFLQWNFVVVKWILTLLMFLLYNLALLTLSAVEILGTVLFSVVELFR